jgi:hypothetical protein
MYVCNPAYLHSHVHSASKRGEKPLNIVWSHYQATTSRNSAVGVATDYRLNYRGGGVRVSVWARFFLSTSCRTVLGPTQPPIQWVAGALSSKIKRPRRKAGHSLPTSAEVKNMWIYKYICLTA